jgi:hypothetical protein
VTSCDPCVLSLIVGMGCRLSTTGMPQAPQTPTRRHHRRTVGLSAVPTSYAYSVCGRPQVVVAVHPRLGFGRAVETAHRSGGRLARHEPPAATAGMN